MLNKTIMTYLRAIFFLAFLFILTPIFAAIEDELILANIPEEVREKALEDLNADASDLNQAIADGGAPPTPKQIKLKKQLEEDDIECEEVKCIFGYKLFREYPTAFVALEETPVTSSYILGPGDELIVNYYGATSRERTIKIGGDGILNLPLLGPVNLSGLTMDDAFDLISNKVAAELIGTKASISIDKSKSIQVYLLGEAHLPGTYTVNSFSSVTNLLFLAGGVSKQGSLRNIQINRSGKTIKTYDFYEFLLKGDTSGDVNLRDGDVVFIPFVDNKIHLEGPFKRPATYEFLENETVKDAIALSGGFKSPLSGTERLGLSFIAEGKERKNDFFSSANIPYGRLLKNGDLITISNLGGQEQNSIELRGEFLYPGVYSFSKGEKILQVINRAGGYSQFAYSEGAVYTRKEVSKKQKEGFERMAKSLEDTLLNMVTTGSGIDGASIEPLNQLIKKLRDQKPIGRQVIDANVLRMKQDPYKNFSMRDGDIFFLPQRPDFINVVGEILNPNTLRFDPSMAVGDYLTNSGGLTSSADKDQIFIINPNGTSYLYKAALFGRNQNLLPGSTIVVARDSRPFDAIKITQIVTPILADLATSAAAIAAISDN